MIEQTLTCLLLDLAGAKEAGLGSDLGCQNFTESLSILVTQSSSGEQIIWEQLNVLSI